MVRPRQLRWLVSRRMRSFVILPIVISVVVVVVVLTAFKKSGAFGPSKAKRELAAQLIATGDKGRAMVMSVQPTGVVVNNINVQCILRFRIEPLRGGQPFEGEKKTLISQVAMPRIGDVWPCWFNSLDHTQFAVGQPSEITPDQITLYREFGIPHPLDPANQQFQQHPGYPPQQPGYPPQGFPQPGAAPQGFQQPPPSYGP